MLKEEAASFAKSDDDNGCIEGLQIDIDLADSTPVQRNYVLIPRLLYQEVKHYIEGLRNKTIHYNVADIIFIPGNMCQEERWYSTSVCGL